MADGFVTMAHGGGGTRMQDLLREVIFPRLGGDADVAEDAACLGELAGRLALTTDSFVVKPLFFSGGDIGKLAVCGTVNDLAMVGAEPRYMSLGLILEEGLPLADLEIVIDSIASTARTAGVNVVAGDTKVVEKGSADGLYINTAGVGTIPEGVEISISAALPGDVLVINGFVGDHGVAVLKDRGAFAFDVAVDSDCAPLNRLVREMTRAGSVHALRDPTRGGLAAALKEMASASGVAIEVDEDAVPVREGVRAVCEVLGLDPFYVANEGKLLAAVPEEDAERVLDAMLSDPLGTESRVIGRVVDGRSGRVTLKGALGSARLLRMPSGEQLPRIC